MTLVMPASQPPKPPRLSDATISLAGGEYGSFQLVLTVGDQALKDVRVQVSDLVNKARGSRIAAAEIEWFEVGYVNIPRPWWTEASLYMPFDNAAGWWPDPLLPVDSFNVAAKSSQPIWVDIHAPRGTPPGEYTGTITLTPAGLPPTMVEVRATVRAFDIPPGAGHFKTAFALNTENMRRIFGGPLDEKTRLQYGDFVLKHRLDPMDLYWNEPPAVSDLEHYLQGGMNAFNIVNVADKEEARKRLTAFMAELKRSPQGEKLRRMAYVYGFDEANPGPTWDTMQDVFGMAHKEFGLPTLTTAFVPQDPKVLDQRNVSWCCPLTGIDPQPTNQYDMEAADRCRAAGHEVWAYICCFPNYPYANINISRNPIIESRVLWWQAYHEKMDGVLYWGMAIWTRPGNSGLIDPKKDGPFLKWNVTTGEAGKSWSTLHGDGMLLYPGVNGPIGSIRLKNIRDGLQDYEYLWRLAQLTGSRDAARKACEPVTRTLETYSRDPARLLAQRAAIARQIETKLGR
jgi:hypothetical protein